VKVTIFYVERDEVVAAGFFRPVNYYSGGA
jgi:hypothetical protein